METIFLEQTSKQVSVDGDRRYITTDQGAMPEFTTYLDDVVYAEAISAFPVECSDVLWYDGNGAVLIGTRQQEPHPGDWVIGGRKQAGESDAQAAIRNTGRELGVTMDPERLHSVHSYDLIWDTRSQPATPIYDRSDPTKITGYAAGAHQRSNLHLYMATAEEITSIKPNQEYANVSWVDLETIVSAPDGVYHPCLVDMAWDSLEVATTPDPSTSVAEKSLRLNCAAAVAVAAAQAFDAQHRVTST